jgi:hypothetical protein
MEHLVGRLAINQNNEQQKFQYSKLKTIWRFNMQMEEIENLTEQFAKSQILKNIWKPATAFQYIKLVERKKTKERK